MAETEELPRIDEIGGYVNLKRAMDMLGTTSQSWLNDLVRAGKIKAVKWDERTRMYNKRSLEHYLQTKQTKHPRKEQEPS